MKKFNRRGSRLERQIEAIFRRAGFRTGINSKRFGFENGVVTMHRNFTIIVECKEYYNSYLNIKNLIHQWNSKVSTSGVDRGIIAIVGVKSSKSEIELARDKGIILWGEKKLDDLLVMETK